MSYDDTANQTTNFNAAQNAEPTPSVPTEPKARPIIRNYALAASAFGFVPIPALDVAMLSSIHVKLIHALAKEYDVPFSKEMGKSVVQALVGSLGTLAVGTVACSAVKVIPGVGTLLGGVSAASIAGAVTFALGTVTAEHFAKEGTLQDLYSAETARKFYEALKGLVGWQPNAV